MTNKTELVDRAHVTRLQAELASANADKKAYGQNAIGIRKQRDALKANLSVITAARNALRSRVDDLELSQMSLNQLTDDLQSELTKAQSRLAQATAIIDYLWLHTELDAIAKTDIDKFYADSTDAEKAARAEMVRVANEPAEGGL